MEATGLSFRSLVSRLLLTAICCVSLPVSVFPGTSPCDSGCEQAKQSYFSGQLEHAAQQFQSLAKQGSADADYYLGLIYLNPGFSHADQQKGLAYLLTAADRDHAEAMWKIGDLYDNGVVVEKNLLLATDWYRKSAQRSDDRTRSYILLLDDNSHESKSPAELISVIIDSANSNNVQSMLSLARMYDYGYLLERDLHQAYHWYHKAALQGDQYAMFITGYFLCRGVASPVNIEQANKWFGKSGRTAVCNNK